MFSVSYFDKKSNQVREACFSNIENVAIITVRLANTNWESLQICDLSPHVKRSIWSCDLLRMKNTAQCRGRAVSDFWTKTQLSAEGVWFKFSLIFALLPSLFECIPSDGGGEKCLNERNIRYCWNSFKVQSAIGRDLGCWQNYSVWGAWREGP